MELIVLVAKCSAAAEPPPWPPYRRIMCGEWLRCTGQHWRVVAWRACPTRPASTHRAAVVSKALTMVGSKVALRSCCRNDGLWKAIHAGRVFEMTRSHSCISSGVSLIHIGQQQNNKSGITDSKDQMKHQQHEKRSVKRECSERRYDLDCREPSGRTGLSASSEEDLGEMWPVSDTAGASWVRFRSGANEVGRAKTAKTVHGASESGLGWGNCRPRRGIIEGSTAPGHTRKGHQGTPDACVGKNVLRVKTRDRLGEFRTTAKLLLSKTRQKGKRGQDRLSGKTQGLKEGKEG